MNEEHPTRKRIRLAWAKLKRDAGPGGKGPSIVAVAREAGVSHTLIHKDYNDIAAAINLENGRSPKQRSEKEREKRKAALARAKELREEIAALKKVNRGLASENATLLLIVSNLEERIDALEAGARPLRPRKSSQQSSRPCPVRSLHDFGGIENMPTFLTSFARRKFNYSSSYTN